MERNKFKCINKYKKSKKQSCESHNEYYSRIRKEIDFLTSTFKEGIIPTNQTINRPMVIFPKNMKNAI